MAYDEELASRIRAHPHGVDGVAEKRMFGGLAFLIDGVMAVAASRSGGLMVRADPDRSEDLLLRPGAEPMVMRGQEMTGWLLVDPAALGDDEVLAEWVTAGLGGAAVQPPKR